MKHPNSLTSKLKVCDREVINYVTALEAENLKLQKKIAKLQVQNTSRQNEIATLKKMQPQKAKLIIKNFYDKDKQNNET